MSLSAYAAVVLDDPAVPDAFRAAVRDLPHITAPLDDFISDAHRNMPRDHDHRWHMLYIDASILRVLARAASPDLDEDAIRDCIATLDRAIIIAGAAIDDTRRDHVLHDILHQLQLAIPCRPPCTAVLVPGSGPVTPLSTCTDTVRARAALPSVVSPEKQWRRAPFVVRQYAHDWPAMHPSHQWASLSYLFSVAGPGRIVPIEVGNDYRSDDWTQTLISWEDFLASLPSADSDQPLYLAQHSLFAQFPKLRDDIVLPDIIYASLDAPDLPAYHAPHDVILNAWLGPKGTISPAHTDPFFNCYVQVVGRKTVWIAPPSVAAAMYPYQLSLAGTDKTHHPAANKTSPLMSNTSQVDVFPAALHDVETSRFTFPLFWERVPHKASCVTLDPGDLLFFPPGWWHAMRSEDVSFSVSMWF